MEKLITTPSNQSFDETVRRVITLIKQKEFTIFAQIDHAAEARQQNLPLRPTKLIIFGNPTIGTILMQDHQSSGIDLPVKILIWEAKSGKTWLSYNSMASLKEKHQLGLESNRILRQIEKVVAAICTEASGN